MGHGDLVGAAHRLFLVARAGTLRLVEFDQHPLVALNGQRLVMPHVGSIGSLIGFENTP